ncbi:hypothetical protein NXX22_26585 [Bacteroides thetaiotaomicron]|uniref:hypothetical protein n=1 Tax=Bacteroides thetaiotaomicron TaxID=818 RepID=UPI002166B019|nr:hypothetical protein [Bacteroides thetaiotaomicron]MCS2785909.1 hypothetical protein [Bacteroides thetaiotaomicron]
MNYSRQYGPVYIWGDIELDELIKPETTASQQLMKTLSQLQINAIRRLQNFLQRSAISQTGRTYHQGAAMAAKRV